ncbi:MAG: hypothetical protein LBP93_02670 [Treponema sp.]|nr:hypothetical protein [Treponema sp.]
MQVPQVRVREEERREIVRNLKKIGVSVDQIIRGTGLSIEEIGQI